MLSLLFGFAEADLQGSVSVRVAWDPNPESNIQGYRIYYGRSAGGVTNVLDVGNQTTGAITNLAYSTPHFFYVTAYNTFGLESDPSEVLTYTTRTYVPLQLSMSGRLITLTPVEITLRANLTGDRSSGGELQVSWREVSSSGVPLVGGNTLSPRVTIASPGSYSFEVTVVDGSSTLVTATSVEAIDGSEQLNRPDPIVLEHQWIPWDDVMYFSWNSRPDRSYALAYTRNFADRTWVPVTLFMPAYSDHQMSGSTLGALGAVFFSVFEKP